MRNMTYLFSKDMYWRMDDRYSGSLNLITLLSNFVPEGLLCLSLGSHHTHGQYPGGGWGAGVVNNN